MYRASEEEMHLCAEDVELAHRSKDSEEEHSIELSRIGRFFRGGLLVAAMLGVVALATLHFNSKMVSTSSGTFQEKSESSAQAFAAATAATNSVYGPSPAPPSTAQGFSSFFGPSPAPAASESVAAFSTASTSASMADAQSSQVVPSVTNGPSTSTPENDLNDGNTPDNDLNDGNKCNDDEEALGTLCYQKCSILTNGEAPVRISAFGCAKSKSLGDVFGEKMAGLVPCQGYDVAGKAEGNGCPHAHGGCLTSEEYSLGKCYKKCSVLTNGLYPHRTTMSTCCKTTNFIECLNPAYFKMDFKFAVGGGEGEHKAIHDPIHRVTET